MSVDVNTTAFSSVSMGSAVGRTGLVESHLSDRAAAVSFAEVDPRSGKPINRGSSAGKPLQTASIVEMDGVVVGSSRGRVFVDGAGAD